MSGCGFTENSLLGALSLGIVVYGVGTAGLVPGFGGLGGASGLLIPKTCRGFTTGGRGGFPSSSCK